MTKSIWCAIVILAAWTAMNTFLLMRNPKQANTQPQWDTQIEFNKATLENIKNLSDAVRFNMTSIDNNAQSIRHLMDATKQVKP